MQTTNHLLMVRPANFARASVTVADNSFQEAVSSETFDEIGEKAVKEFDTFVALLRSVGVTVTVIEDTTVPVKPDAVFPNNWFSTHNDGLFITYPTYWPQRRLERREDVMEKLDEQYLINRSMDLSQWEEEGRFLESTGSLILDRDRRIAYACLSQRCSIEAVHDWCEIMGYKPVTFTATDLRDEVIYHTNVMMALGSDTAVVCLDALKDPAEKSKLTESLVLTGKRIVGLSLTQIDQFAGNALEVVTPNGPLWVMSTSAFNALADDQRDALMSPSGMRILHSDLSTIERYGGGSARCMLGEIFLPVR